MNRLFTRSIAAGMVVLMLVGLLVACVTQVARPGNVTTGPVVTGVETNPPVTVQPPVTEPPKTEPPVTEPPATDPPKTEPPATKPPVTEPPAIKPPATKPPVTVPPVIPVTSLKLSKTELSLVAGTFYNVTATISPANATDKTVSWTSSNKSVAIVNGGRITAVKAGTAVITAKSGACSATVKVTVMEPSSTSPVTKPVVPPEDSGSVSFTTSPSQGGPEIIQRPLALEPWEYYGYQFLGKQSQSASLQLAYQKLAAAVANMEDVVEMSDPAHPLTEAQLKTVFFCYRYDYPQHFWLNLGYGYSLDQYSRIDKVYLKYIMTRAEAIQAQKTVNRVTDQLLEGITVSMSEYERELLIHDRLIDYINYDTAGTAKYTYTMYTALSSRVATCEGYARTLQYMLYQVGIQAAVVVGQARGTSHAWTLVRIDGEYYYCDPTWDDPIINSKVGYESHAYFNVTTRELALAGYEISSKATMYDLPICSATAANYCTVMGAEASLDLREIAHAIGRLYQSGARDFFSVRVNSDKVLSIDDLKAVLAVDAETFQALVREVTGSYPSTGFYGWLSANGTNVFTFYFERVK